MACNVFCFDIYSAGKTLFLSRLGNDTVHNANIKVDFDVILQFFGLTICCQMFTY